MDITSQHNLASSITRAASKQTYYTIRLLADRGRVEDAYCAYAYFRWVDDTLDSPQGSSRAKIAFIERQKSLLETCYQGKSPHPTTHEEAMLVQLVRHDPVRDSGLHTYLRSMMQVMDFDAKRRDRWITQIELNEYTRWLATAVTEAMHYFIGNGCFSPRDETRYLAVTAAHITHMLRDTFDDVRAGYYNIPREILEGGRIRPEDIHNKIYRDWVRSRVQLARTYFHAGRDYLARVENPRCRLAGFAYTARFEWLLDTFEREEYYLRPEYGERKSLGRGVRMGLSALPALILPRDTKARTGPVLPQSMRKA